MSPQFFKFVQNLWQQKSGGVTEKEVKIVQKREYVRAEHQRGGISLPGGGFGVLSGLRAHGKFNSKPQNA